MDDAFHYMDEIYEKKKLIISSYCPDVQNLSQNLYYLLLLFFFKFFAVLIFIAFFLSRDSNLAHFFLLLYRCGRSQSFNSRSQT